MFGPFALVAASLFTGAAVYINWAEQPARLGLDDRALLQQWKPSYARGFIMQASLAVIGGIFGILEWLVTGNLIWLAGGIVLLANLPYTLIMIMPVINTLDATPPVHANALTRELIEQWGRLHAARSALGALSVALFLWASI